MKQAITFSKAVRANLNVRLALCGPTGSGKTYTALSAAQALAEGGTVAVIDSERSSSNRYADRFSFDLMSLTSFHPDTYIDALEAAAAAGYRVIIIDSLSHAWDGTDGLLSQVDAITKRSKMANSFTSWREATPIHNRLIDAILDYPGHVIVTMRSKMEYVLETNSQGKMAPRKVAMAPIQRQGMEYEFDICADLDNDHNLVISKSRAESLDGKVINKPGPKFGAELLAWAKGGVSTPATRSTTQQPKPVAPAPTAPTAPTTDTPKSDNQSITETETTTPPATVPPAKETKPSNESPATVDHKTWLDSVLGAICRNPQLQELALKVRNEMSFKSFGDLRTAAPEIIGAFREKLGAERKAAGV